MSGFTIHRRGSTLGFTLMEIMVSLSLFSMILLLLFSSLYSANHSWKIGEKRLEKNDEMRLASQFIRRQIAAAIPMVWVKRKKQVPLFQGQADSLSFVTSFPAHRGGGGAYIMVLKLNEDDDISSLDLVYRPLHPDDYEEYNDVDSAEEQVSLLDNITAIQFQYYGIKHDEVPRWHDRWVGEKRLPELIKLTIQTTSTGYNWPSINMATQMDFSKKARYFTMRSKTDPPSLL